MQAKKSDIKLLLSLLFMTMRDITYMLAAAIIILASFDAYPHPTEPADTTNALISGDINPEYAFDAKQLILPGALIAAGTAGVYMPPLKKLNRNIKNGMDDMRGTHYFRADDYMQYLPAITYLTFGAIGIHSKHSFKERLAVEATAYLAMAAITNIGKYTVRERRPDSSARNSFPSGHTATVFTGAELMREEYGTGLGIAAYTVATGVAFLRLYNGRHWFNDVIAGCGIGILSARIGYWMLPLYRKWFKWDSTRNYASMAFSPTYNTYTKNFSLNVAINF